MLMTWNFQAFIRNNFIKVRVYFVSHFCNTFACLLE